MIYEYLFFSLCLSHSESHEMMSKLENSNKPLIGTPSRVKGCRSAVCTGLQAVNGNF